MVGKNGEKAGQDGADGKYVAPKTHIIVTSQTLFERWLRAHKEWWGNNVKNVPQQIGAALKDESFYTQAVSSGAAVVNFNSLPIAKPAGGDLRAWDAGGPNPVGHSRRGRHRLRLGDRQRQGDVAYGSIDPKVQIPACIAIRASYNKKAEQAEDDLRFEKIDRKVYDRLGNLARKARTNTSAASRRMRKSRPSFAEAKPGRPRTVFGGAQYALSRSTLLALASKRLFLDVPRPVPVSGWWSCFKAFHALEQGDRRAVVGYRPSESLSA